MYDWFESCGINVIAERINGVLNQEFLLEELYLSLTEKKKVVRDVAKSYNDIMLYYLCACHTLDCTHLQHNVKNDSYRWLRNLAECSK